MGSNSFFALMLPYSKSDFFVFIVFALQRTFDTNSFESSASCYMLFNKSTNKNSGVVLLGKGGFTLNENILPPRSKSP